MKKVSLFIFSSLSITILIGCQTTLGGVDQTVKNKIALCNAGASASLSAGVEAKIAKNILDGVKADVGVTNELKGLLLNSDKVNADNIDSVYDKYIKCLEK